MWQINVPICASQYHMLFSIHNMYIYTTHKWNVKNISKNLHKSNIMEYVKRGSIQSTLAVVRTP